MKDNIQLITINLYCIIRRLEKLVYEGITYEVEQKIQVMNDKIYELSDMLESIEDLLE